MTSREFRERLAKRARKADVGLSPAIVEQLEAYYRLLARWNAKINLTALPLSEPNDQALDRLLVEPLAAARHVPDSAIVWFDAGSGGGSPAIPLKIARPAARLTMVESKTRKAAFLREAVRTLGLTGSSVENARFEALARPDTRKSAHLVTVRAVKLDQAFFDVARELLREDGRLFLFQSDEGPVKAGSEFRLAQTAKLSASPSQLVILAANLERK